jgi:very-short-patch-repair endonuclease
MAKTLEYPIVCIPELVKQKKQFIPLIFPSGQGDAPIGASERLFENVLKHYFGEIVSPQQMMLPLGHDLHYTADFLIVEPTTGLHIDLEVDEPTSFVTGKPTHYIGEDDYRNKCFVDANWLVIRFAEEQVSSQPERCARFIAGAIAQLTGNNTYRRQLLNVEKVTPMKQWSYRQASSLKKKDYRQGYLQQRRN